MMPHSQGWPQPWFIFGVSICSVFGREITKYTVVFVQGMNLFWLTLRLVSTSSAGISQTAL